MASVRPLSEPLHGPPSEGVFARALDRVLLGYSKVPPLSLPLSLPSVLLSLGKGKWQWPSTRVKYVNFSSSSFPLPSPSPPPFLALNQNAAARLACLLGGDSVRGLQASPTRFGRATRR